MKSWNASASLYSPATVFCFFESLLVSRYLSFFTSTMGVKPLPQPEREAAYELPCQTHSPRNVWQDVQLLPRVESSTSA